ncbi:MAG: protein-tyrosine phosphatase family protein [Ilumatobacteraceae bacterium]
MHPSEPGFGAELGVLPSDRSYWVVPGRLLAGVYPGSSDPERALARTQALVDVGVRRVVNLTESGEGSHVGTPLTDYEPELAAAAGKRGVDVTAIRLPIVDLDIPDRAHMAVILDAVDEGIDRGETVYVHCWGGRGRTGTVVGCWLARHDLATGDRALRMIRYLRRTYAKAETEAPETAAQKQFVLDWRPGE